jgi:hypothetical protein
MKQKLSFLLIVAGLFISSNLFAQKVILQSGKLDALKGEKSLKLEFVYDASVGKYAKESEYISAKKEEYNKKEAGKGDKWEEAWNGDKVGRYEPAFRTKLLEVLSEKGINSIGKDVDAKYTMIVKTTRIEPGWNIYIQKRFAEIDAEVTIVETANKNNVIAKMELVKMPGRTYGSQDLDTGVRLSEAYEKAAKDLGKFIIKNGLK